MPVNAAQPARVGRTFRGRSTAEAHLEPLNSGGDHRGGEQTSNAAYSPSGDLNPSLQCRKSVVEPFLQ